MDYQQAAVETNRHTQDLDRREGQDHTRVKIGN
jgi:hypothetical protein